MYLNLLDIVNGMRYIAMVHTWKDGSIDYVSVLDNKQIKVEHMGGNLSPLWLKERAALLRLCEINRGEKGDVIGRRFSETLVYVYLDKKEYVQLSKLTGAKDEAVHDAKNY